MPHTLSRFSSARPARVLATVALGAVALAGCAGAPTESAATPSASHSAVSLTNCGEHVHVDHAPTKLVTLNQGATEVALALGLEKSMVGTAYLDDSVSPKLKAAYESVPVLAPEYPSLEAFTAAGPDFAYAAYASAFTDKAVGTRQELAGKKIGTYLSPFGCPKGTPRAEPTFESAWSELTDVAAIFGVPAKATEVIDAQKAQLEKIRSAAAGKGAKVFWYDSGDKTPFVGAGKGGPQLIIDAVGGTNIFASLDGGWADGSWEDVVAAQPDVIVLADASWDTAETKKAHLKADPTLSALKAVQEDRFVVLPFSATTPGVRLVEGAESVASQIAALPAK